MWEGRRRVEFGDIGNKGLGIALLAVGEGQAVVMELSVTSADVTAGERTMNQNPEGE